MAHSRQLAGLIGPTMIALGVTEAMNMDIFANQIAPVVYLNGAILFVAGLAIVRTHNVWTWHWSVIITLVGWIASIGGLWRMAAPSALQASENVMISAMLAAIASIGALLSFIAYGPKVFSVPKATDV
jgi:hypothetical protein